MQRVGSSRLAILGGADVPIQCVGADGVLILLRSGDGGGMFEPRLGAGDGAAIRFGHIEEGEQQWQLVDADGEKQIPF